MPVLSPGYLKTFANFFQHQNDVIEQIVIPLDEITSYYANSFDFYYNILNRCIICSAEVRSKGMTLVVDARGTTLPVLNTLLETLYTVEVSGNNLV